MEQKLKGRAEQLAVTFLQTTAHIVFARKQEVQGAIKRSSLILSDAAPNR
jgi:hypothetical protein